ncbi:MAG: EamA family transporter [Sediminibacterium sp. Gen4]|jgi:drug/metabolite transporter (DMT)-like permease|uniref:EamA family transporter n=1 Tax=unclassified Sediminibacterium TaxID=2635961 RepID=UPI0015BA426E|nr:MULTISPECIES: EamA family transporter [unclassified Sediminibacterium]MBW0160287.1 EamA family transporter [Sediminibacterium sp.]MBW0165838.1 EamA family transporter [Sediminibacterium sp.]NWK64805.1 EamA family transporter [Sediminibacterium sp. Gen4]
MIFLIGSIVLTSYLTLSFKACEKYGVNVFQAIVFNYITCVITGSFVNGAFPVHTENIQTPWFGWAMIMGVMFVSIFNIVAITAQKNGVAVASVANKLSLIIPVILSVYLYKETVAGWKAVGVGLALVAVVLTCYTKTEKGHTDQKNKWVYLLPLVLFISSGLLDALINHVQLTYVTTENNNDYLVSSFFSAATIGSLLLLIQLIRKKQVFVWKNLLAGVLIGIPNYFSIWCLVHFLQESPWQTSASIPVNNMGIVLFSAVVAWILFKERLTKINWLGILLSLVAIYLIAFGDQL